MTKSLFTVFFIGTLFSTNAFSASIKCRLAQPAKHEILRLEIKGDDPALFRAGEAHGRARVFYQTGHNKISFDVAVSSYYSKPFTVNIFTSRQNNALRNFSFYLRSNRITDEDQSQLNVGLFGQNRKVTCLGGF